MSSLLELLTDQLSGDPTAQISRQGGADEGATGKAIGAALPMLMGVLANNASQGGGAQSLAGALDRDHDGSVLDDISGFLGNPDVGSGEGILGHALGARRGAVESELGRQTGLDMSTIGKLLPILAPLVMGALGRAKREQQLDVGGLASMLGGEREQADRMSAGSMGILAQLLDADNDGQVADDVAKLGGGLLGKLFGRRR
jgi:hypothetical protein